MNVDRYRPIGEYGLIGDCRSAALVGPDGSIDWFCWPRFDSPAMFARILDVEQGGFWRVGPAQPNGAGAMRYRADTAVLETEHRTSQGVVRVVDAMPPADLATDGATMIMRLVEGVEGTVDVVSVLDARLGFGQVDSRVSVSDSSAEVTGTSSPRGCT